MIVAVVGAVKAGEVVKLLEQTLGDWQNPAQQTDFAQPEAPLPGAVQVQTVELPGKTQSDIVLGIAGPPRHAPDFQAARIANNVLGVFGMMGRLGASVREEKGLAYYSYSSIEGGLSQGAWQVSAGVNPANVRLAVASIRQEIERMLDEPISAADLADNQANLVGRLPLLLETNESVASNLLTMERYRLGLDYLRNYADEINTITIKDVQAAMRKYWRKDAFCLAIAGPALKEPVL